MRLLLPTLLQTTEGVLPQGVDDLFALLQDSHILISGAAANDSQPVS
ncbi:hypothetical protein [Dickeya fangzhongdai]|nr:hypothetical protein [Dickeya fangzhongdai]